MNPVTRIIALALAILAMLSVSSSCQVDMGAEKTSTEPVTEQGTDSDHGQTETNAASSIIGKVLAVENDSVMLEIYSAKTDYPRMNIYLAPTGEQTERIISSNAVCVYLCVGDETPTTLDAIKAGEMITLSSDKEGSQKVYIHTQRSSTDE